MELPEKSSPFKLLHELNELYTLSKADLPAQKRIEASSWTGIGFRLGKYHLTVAIQHLEEILTEPSYAPLPVVKSWVKGVANMRGHLLPVINLNELFSVTSDTTRKQRRIMAIKVPEQNFVGCVVDAVFGMQQFSEHELSNDIPSVPELLTPFISGVYKAEKEWLIFDTDSFLSSQLFLTIGY